MINTEQHTPAAAALRAVADEWSQFVDWASAEGLIRESFGIRSTSSMCDVALKAWKAGRAALVAASVQQPASKDTCAEMRALCSACGCTGDVHSIDGEWLGQCNCVHAWQLRAERAEADLAKANEWRAAALAESQQSGERWAKRVAELEAQLAHRRAALSPETQQAIAAARAAGQSIAATPAGMVFMNDGAEPGGGELDCPACGGSGHAADVPARSAP